MADITGVMGAYKVYPVAGDFEPDEDVDMSDLAEFCGQWLNLACLGPGLVRGCGF